MSAASLEFKLELIENSDWDLAYDGCHKIYWLENSNDLKEALELEYEIHAASQVRELYYNSCGLEFVSSWSYAGQNKRHPLDISQWENDDEGDE